MEKQKKGCCYQCSERTATCHPYCKRYEEESKTRQAKAAIIREKKEAENNYLDYKRGNRK